MRDFERGPFSGREKLGFRFADRLHESAHNVDDEFYGAVKKVFNDREVIELAATAAAFEMFTRFVDVLHIAVTPSTAAARPSGGKEKI